jgi:serine phosphatase RsbU (regulator of sigma subunit)
VDHPFLVVLYTDGLSEAHTGSDLFGTERLPNLVRALSGVPLEGQAAGLVEEATRYAGGMLRDDVVVVLIRPASAP